MNRKGQVIFYTIMLAIVIIVLALAFAPVIKVMVDDARADNTNTKQGLNCSNPLISDYDAATCLFTDITMPYFIGSMLGIAGIIIGAKLIFGA